MSQNSSSRSIGMFDSGVGGLTVMKKVIHALPEEHIVYFGDTARVPYGCKSKETIIKYSIENSIFLMEHSIKVLVIACNTAASYSLEKLQQIFNIPIVDVIQPGAQAAVNATKNGNIAVLGTRATIQSGVYQKEISQRLPNAHVTAVACPLFVPLVEEHLLNHAAAKMIVQEYLQPIMDKKIDTILLGCTHYPLLQPLIREYVGPEVAIVDSGQCCAEKVSQVLQTHSLQSKQGKVREHKYYVSDDPDKFQKMGKLFLGMPLTHVELLKS